VYHVDLQADVGLASCQIDLVPTEIVQCQPAGARHLILTRAQINVNLRQKAVGAALVKVSLIFTGVIVNAPLSQMDFLRTRGTNAFLFCFFSIFFFRDRLFLLEIELRFPAVDPVRFMPFRVSQPTPCSEQRKKILWKRVKSFHR